MELKGNIGQSHECGRIQLIFYGVESDELKATPKQLFRKKLIFYGVERESLGAGIQNAIGSVNLLWS